MQTDCTRWLEAHKQRTRVNCKKQIPTFLLSKEPVMSAPQPLYSIEKSCVEEEVDFNHS